MLQPDIDSLFLRGKGNPTHLPGLAQTQQLGEKLDVTHGWIPP
jgi:hypothetical protein